MNASIRAGLVFAGCGLALVVPGRASGAAGDLDPSFGFGDGMVRTNVTSGDDIVIGVEVQPDGKIVAVGDVAGLGGRFGVVRYVADGALDPGFGTGGRVLTNVTPGRDEGIETVLQGDGKIVVAGYAGGLGGRMMLARYETDGDLDPTFGGDGIVTANFTPRADFAFGLVLQSDGKLVAAGGAGGRFGVARFEADGDLDPTFGGDGKVRTDFTNGDDRADMVALQADGSIVAAGVALIDGDNARFALARYDTSGLLDPGFGGDGKVRTDFFPGFDSAWSVGVQADQKIVAAGQGGRKRGVAVARYNADGTLDTGGFSGDGKIVVNVTDSLDYADDLALQADGKIVLAGSTRFLDFGGPDSKFLVVRLDTDGSLDPSFGGDGRVTTDFGPGRDGAFNLAIQPMDGRIVVAGFSGRRFGLARYLVD